MEQPSKENKIYSSEEIKTLMHEYFKIHMRFKVTHVVLHLETCGVIYFVPTAKKNNISRVSSHSIKSYLSGFRREGTIRKYSTKLWESLIYSTENEIIKDIIEATEENNDKGPSILPGEVVQEQSSGRDIL